MNPQRRSRLVRGAWLVVTGLLLVFAAFELWVGYRYGLFPIGVDYAVMMDSGRRWLQNGGYFLEWQLHGPYQAGFQPLYPPAALWLFVPFSFLPGFLWYAVPASIVGASIYRLRPAPWALAAMSALLLSPIGMQETMSGNSIIWVEAGLFAAVAFGTPASLILLKPSLFPFALFGVWRRRWWLGLALLVALSIPAWTLNLTWLQVISDIRGRSGLLYSIGEFPYAAIPFVAWLGSTRRPPLGLPRWFVRRRVEPRAAATASAGDFAR